MTCTIKDIWNVRSDCELLIGALYNAERALLDDAWTTPKKRQCAQWLKVAFDHASEVAAVIVIDLPASDQQPHQLSAMIDVAIHDLQALFCETYERANYAPSHTDARAWAGAIAGMLLGLSEFNGLVTLPTQLLETASTASA